MFGTPLSTALLVLAPAPSCSSTPPPTAGPQDGPPGLILVEGGKTRIGSKVEDIEQIIEEHEPEFANTLAGETPQHSERVDDFYLMPTEVTNEQYAAYVRATGAQPPYYWGQKALEAGRMAFLEEQGKLIQEARAKGQTIVRKKFEAGDWWDENWRDCEWAVPEDEATRPVVYINYENARDYAAWAGLRLMTEFEYTRAARRDSDNVFPWGNQWNQQLCNSLELDTARTMPVASFPDGAVEGIYDLAGNVWEWTSSPYRKFDGYRMLRVKIGRGRQSREISAGADFNPDERVLVGGSYGVPSLGVRVATRQGSRRDQRTEGLGFRCAADVVPGKTVAARVLDDDIDFKVLPEDTDFYPDAVVALQHWESRVGSVNIDGYAVITGHERMVFCPVLSIPAASKSELARSSQEEPVFLGFVAMSLPLVEPAIDGGTYLVAWRGAGKVKAPEDADEATQNLRVAGARQATTNFWEVDGFDEDEDCFFLYGTDGQPIVAFPAGEPSFKKMRPGSVTLEPFVPPTEKEMAERAKQMELAQKGKADPPPPIIPQDTLKFSIAVAGKTRSKGVLFDLPLKVAPGTVDESWK